MILRKRLQWLTVRLELLLSTLFSWCEVGKRQAAPLGRRHFSRSKATGGRSPRPRSGCGPANAVLLRRQARSHAVKSCCFENVLGALTAEEVSACRSAPQLSGERRRHPFKKPNGERPGLLSDFLDGEIKHLGWRYAKGVGQHANIDECDVALPTLDPANIGPR